MFHQYKRSLVQPPQRKRDDLLLSGTEYTYSTGRGRGSLHYLAAVVREEGRRNAGLTRIVTTTVNQAIAIVSKLAIQGKGCSIAIAASSKGYDGNVERIILRKS